MLKRVGNSGPQFSPLPCKGAFGTHGPLLLLKKAPFQQWIATLWQSIYSQLGQGTTAPNYQQRRNAKP